MNRHLILFLSLTVYCQVVLSQDNFSKGVAAAQQNKYIVADSLFTEYLKTNPLDVNAAFNRANVKLQLGDTCVFCNIMHEISVAYKDKEAWKLFTKICGKTDSLYCNDNFELTKDKKSRYLIVSIPNFCDKSYEVNIHDNKRKNVSIITSPDLFSSYRTNVIASYRLNNDGYKTYLFLVDSNPIFPGGNEKKDLYKEMNIDIQQIKKELNLYHVVVNVVYIIDKTGNIKDLKIVRIKGDLKDEETIEKLKIYINSYFMNMPKHIPAKFRNENVDFQVQDMITFW